MERNEKKKGNKMYIPLIAVVVVVLVSFIYWYRGYLLYISTDDAHVDSENVAISSKILGRINHLTVDEGDTVKQGQLLAELDSADLLAQRKQTFSALQQAMASQSQAEAKYTFDEQNIKVTEINFNKAQEDYNRAKSQIASDVITKEQFDHVQKAYETAKAQLEAAKAQLNVSKAQINTAVATVESAKASIGVITTQLANTRLYAPFNGIVAKRWLLAGDIVQAGQSVFSLNNNNKLWVIIYIEETKVSDIYIGQKAIFDLDAFSGVKFTGKVYSIGSNTASQFSLIPANNASGNFTKVTQRVPVKISIDGTEDNSPLQQYKILSGMSAVVKIYKK